MSDTIQMPKDLRRLITFGFLALLGFLGFVLFWSVWAEFSKTLRISGHISSDAPSFELQHPNGGRIAHVHVTLHDEVAQGDILFEFDMRDQLLRLSAIEERRAHLLIDINAANARLDPEADRRPIASAYRAQVAVIGANYDHRDQALETRRADLQGRIRMAAAQEVLQDHEMSMLERRIALLETRLAKTEDLVSRGAVPSIQLENMRQDLLQLRAQRSTMAARINQTVQTAEAAELQLNLIAQENLRELSEIRLRAQKELTQLDAEAERLRIQISQSILRAPVSGMVTNLPFGNDGMVARGGASLAVISQPLSEPVAELRIPPSYIDQVFVGQSGQIAISSLPQRDAPKLHLTLRSIGSEPVRDKEGNTAYFIAKAAIDGDDLDLARTKLGDRFDVTLGVPVTATLIGDSTTLWTYLTNPVTSMWANAFED